jgi:hypothetical protein
MGIAMDQKWKSFERYEPIKLELHKSVTGKKFQARF